MAQQHTVRGVHTAVFTDENGLTRVVYRGTCVVAFDDEKVILNSGGYETSTTKTRMMQASNEHRLGYQVFQRDFRWYVRTPQGENVEFKDGMTIPR